MSSIDRFANLSDAPDFSAKSILAITPNDSTDLAFVTKALYVTADGNISIIAQEDADPVTLPVTAGQIIPIRVKRVRATGTTATVVGLY